MLKGWCIFFGFMLLTGCDNRGCRIEETVENYANVLSCHASIDGLWKDGTNILSRIAAETNDCKAAMLYDMMADAIIGMRLRRPNDEESNPNSVKDFHEWDMDVGLQGKLVWWHCISSWDRLRDSHRVWDLRLRHLAVCRKELDWISGIFRRQHPTCFKGVHQDVEMLRRNLEDEIRREQRHAFSSRNFRKYYDALSPEEQRRWPERIEDASGIAFRIDR